MSTEERILYAAMQIIGESGLKGLSAAKLAEAVQISKSTVFHHFKRMDDIPALILEKLYEEIINPVQEEHYDGVRSYLKALGSSSFPDNQQHILIYKAFVSLFQASMHDPQLQQIVGSCSQQFGTSLAGKLQSLSGKALEDVESLTNLIFMTLDGVGLHYLVHRDQTRAQKVWDLFVDTLCRQYNFV